MAQQYEQAPLQLRIIGQHQDISVKYLEQLMAMLKGSGLVKSVRGARGGYMLTRAPSQIRMDDIFHCLEGQAATLECVENAGSCKRAMDCAARGLWTKVDRAINEALRSVTLQDLADKAKSGARQEYEI